MQVQQRLAPPASPGGDGPAVTLVAVGFSPAEALAPLADHLAWSGRFLADPRRRLYQRLGLGRAPVWRVYAPRTLAWYAAARVRGRHLRPPVEDTRQMGGDAIAVDGTVTHRWLPRTPDDRVDPDVLAAAARGT